MSASVFLTSPGLARADGSDTLFVAQREDHSPSLALSPAGRPVVVWIASAPDTNAVGRFDEIAIAAHDDTPWGAPQILAGPGNYYTPSAVYSTDGARWVCFADHDGTDSQILLRRDLGDSTASFELGDPTKPDLEPAICADDSGGVVVVW